MRLILKLSRQDLVMKDKIITHIHSQIQFTAKNVESLISAKFNETECSRA